MKEAKIKCPSCGCQITVRAKESSESSMDQAETKRTWEAVDELFKVVDSTFKKVFRR